MGGKGGMLHFERLVLKTGPHLCNLRANQPGHLAPPRRPYRSGRLAVFNLQKGCRKY